MEVIKRNGDSVEFDRSKIEKAISKANNEVKAKERANKKEIKEIIEHIESLKKGRILVEDIQDIIEKKLMEYHHYELAKKYIIYRWQRALVRKANTTDQSIKELIDGTSEYWNTENSNKNARVVTTQRDYLAGITSTDITRRFLLPEDIVKAHDEGIIHFHDADYFAQNALHNCDLINLEDMLQNGTNINGVMIEKPHKFLTAMTIATQIITAVSSSQYGGATVTMTHLAPFVRDSYNKYLEKYRARNLSEEQCIQFAKEDTEKEVKDGVQTFQYQVNSMTTTNGQAPFLSVCLYLGETEEYKEELALIIKEFLEQRILGMKNSKGVYITPAFPKLLYILEEDNIHEDSKYWYLTELAAKCTAKRMVPDYISEKVMKQLKKNEYGIGDCYPCMGAAAFDETVSIKIKDKEFNNISIKDAVNMITLITKSDCKRSGYKYAIPYGVIGVYRLTHKPTGLYYIGSSKDIKRRFVEHVYAVRHRGSLGDNYFIGDYDIQNYSLDVLEECSADNLIDKEDQYINLHDDKCVNFKSCLNNGNFTSENRLLALEGIPYSEYKNKTCTWVKVLNRGDIFVKSNNQWQPIRRIIFNSENSPLKLFHIKYEDENNIEHMLKVTEDHPLHTTRGRIIASDLTTDDYLISVKSTDNVKLKYKIIDVTESLDKVETFDFEVDNDIFDLSGIISHNCRSFLTPYTDTEIVKSDEEFELLQDLI